MATKLSHIEKLEKRLNKFHYWLLGAIVFLFFVHGALYVINPLDIYNPSSPIKLIKYALLFGLFMLGLRGLNYTKLLMLGILFITMFFFHYFSREIGYGVSTKSILLGFFGYAFPMLVIPLHKFIKKANYFKIVPIVLALSSLIGYVEYVFLRGLFEKFSGAGYRVVSIFVNPNNAGILFAIMTYFVLEKIEFNNALKNLLKGIVILNGIAIIFLTGSKTALAALVLFLGLHFLKELINNTNKLLTTASKLLYLGSFVGIALIAFFEDRVIDKFSTFSLGGDSREMNLNTGRIRLQSAMEFFERISDNFFYPYRSSMMYIDNVYLEMWGDYGILVLILFLSFNIYLFFQCLKASAVFELSLLFVILVLGLSTNFIYLWPIGYIYWFLAVEILNKHTKVIKE